MLAIISTQSSRRPYHGICNLLNQGQTLRHPFLTFEMHQHCASYILVSFWWKKELQTYCNFIQNIMSKQLYYSWGNIATSIAESKLAMTLQLLKHAKFFHFISNFVCFLTSYHHFMWVFKNLCLLLLENFIPHFPFPYFDYLDFEMKSKNYP
jgi:hypothetical protein